MNQLDGAVGDSTDEDDDEEDNDDDDEDLEEKEEEENEDPAAREEVDIHIYLCINKDINLSQCNSPKREIVLNNRKFRFRNL